MSVIRLVALAAAISTMTAGSQQIGQPRFTSDVTAVRLDVYVDGIPPAVAAALKAKDFEVLDDGVPQRVALLDTESMPINVVLLLDVTLSTAGTPLRALSEAVQAMTSALDQRDQVALLIFRELVTGVVPLTLDRLRVKDALSNVRGFGRTGLHDAVVAGLAVAENAPGRTLLLVASDGLDNTSFLRRPAVEDVLRACEAVVYAVSIGRAPAPGVPLNWISDASGGESFRLAADAPLAPAFLRVLDRFRRRHVISFYPAPDGSPKWHKLQVRLKARSGSVRHRSGYWSVNAH